MPLAPGDTFFEYHITRALGQGAFGTVYLAQDTLLDRPVAIKELTAAAQADPVAFQRFLQEARAAGSLNHPNIVTVHTLKPVQGTVYLVMEYLSGGSLRALLEKRGRLPMDDAISIAADVCDGLAAAHAKGIVHRDIKPDNVLLTAIGQAKIGDFGIAHVPRSAGGASLGGLTQTGFQPGTLIYMSSEQIRGEAIDGRSDVYQVGLLLHEMLTGRCCIDIEGLTRRAQGTSGGNVLRMQARLYDLLEEAICRREPPDVRLARPDVPVWLAATVARALARPAASRPTAERLSGELRKRDKDGPDDQDSVRNRFAPGIVARLFGRKAAERPGSAESSQPVTPPKADKATPPAVPGQKMVDGGRKATSLAEGYPNRAIDKNQVAPQNGPDKAQKHINLGAALGQQGRIDEAISEFQAALRINPGLANAHYNLGVALWQQGRFDEVISELQEALRLDPGFAEAHNIMGEVYNAQGRTEEAIREFQAALRIDPAIEVAHFSLGNALWEQGRTDEAISEFQAALQINPDIAEAHYNLGMALAEQGRTEEAIHEYQTAARINPDDGRAHCGLGVALEQLGRTDEAIRAYQESVRINPDNAVAYFNLGTTFCEQGRENEAIAALREALRADPNHAEAHFNLGAILGNQGSLEEEIHEYQEVLRINPKDDEAYYNLGLVYGKQGRADEAISSYQAALRIKPKNAKYHRALGKALDQLGRNKEAAIEYQMVLQIDPNDAETHFDLGAALGEQGRLEEEIREYQAALRINPELAEARYNLGVAYAQQGRIPDAIRSYQAALHVRPDYAAAHYNLATTFLRQGRIDEAISEYEAVLRILPDSTDTHNQLGVALGQLGRLDEAIAEFQAMRRISPEDAGAHYNLGKAYLLQDRLAEALEEAHLALQLGYEGSQQLLRDIEGQLAARNENDLDGEGDEYDDDPDPNENDLDGESDEYEDDPDLNVDDLEEDDENGQMDDQSGMHRIAFLRCMGLVRGDSTALCNAVLGIVLDMGQIGIICPRCNALYFVDPPASRQDPPRLTSGSFEVDGQRIEVFNRLSERNMRQVVSSRLGWEGKVYVANVYSQDKLPF